MGEYLYTGAWQLLGPKNGDEADLGRVWFGGVRGQVRLSGEGSVYLSFHALKVPIEADEHELVIELPEAWARVLAEELRTISISSDYLYSLYRQGRLTDIHSDDPDRTALEETHNKAKTEAYFRKLAANPIARKMTGNLQNAEIRTESLQVSNRQEITQELVEVGSVTAYGSIRGRSTIQLRLRKAAIRLILADRESLEIELPKASVEDLSLRVREAEVQCRQLRALKRANASMVPDPPEVLSHSGKGDTGSGEQGAILLSEIIPLIETRDRIEELDLGITPEAAVTSPFLLQDDHSAYLTFNAIRLTSDGRREDAGTAIVELVRCYLTKFGYPNDEALAGHPLYAKGLDRYGIFEVHQSSWVSELAAQNRVSFPNYTMTAWRHFIFTFHDSTFECIAKDLNVEVSQEPCVRIFQKLSARLL